MNWPAWEHLYDEAVRLFEAEPSQTQFYIMIGGLLLGALILQGLVSLFFLSSTIRNAYRRSHDDALTD